MSKFESRFMCALYYGMKGVPFLRGNRSTLPLLYLEKIIVPQLERIETHQTIRLAGAQRGCHEMPPSRTQKFVSTGECCALCPCGAYDGIQIKASVTQKVGTLERFIGDTLGKLNNTPHNERFIVEYGGTYSISVQLCVCCRVFLRRKCVMYQIINSMENLKNFTTSFSMKK